MTGTDTWVARCPAHDDKNPSMTVRETDDGMILMHCFAGCEVAEIAGAMGISLSELFPERPEEHSRRGIKKPFPAAAVMKAVAHEALIVRLAAEQMIEGELTPRQVERLALATTRLQEAMLHV